MSKSRETKELGYFVSNIRHSEENKRIQELDRIGCEYTILSKAYDIYNKPLEGYKALFISRGSIEKYNNLMQQKFNEI